MIFKTGQQVTLSNGTTGKILSLDNKFAEIIDPDKILSSNGDYFTLVIPINQLRKLNRTISTNIIRDNSIKEIKQKKIKPSYKCDYSIGDSFTIQINNDVYNTNKITSFRVSKIDSEKNIKTGFIRHYLGFWNTINNKKEFNWVDSMFTKKEVRYERK